MESLHENERKRREERGGAGRVVFIRSSVLLCVCVRGRSKSTVAAGLGRGCSPPRPPGNVEK